jgi:Zn-finger nucleic acid-binding protein
VALNCPQCATEMREVKAPAVTGYWLALDQCPGCGGIWCDRWEVFPLTAAGAAQLDSVDVAALSKPVSASPPLRCPRCRARMAPFRDRALPSDARIDRCRNCEGMWFNRGELRRFKGRGAPAPDVAVSHAEVDRLAQAAGEQQSWPTVRNLDTAMDMTPAAGDANDLPAELAAGVGWLILRALVRLLLHV